MKKVLSVLTALVLVLALAIPVFAAGDKTITIMPNDKVTLAGRTFTAYKVLDATKTGSNIVYSVPEGAVDFMATYFSIDKDDIAFSYKVAEAIRAFSDDARMTFAAAVLEGIRTSEIKNVTGVEGAADGNNYVISGLSEGYYIVKDSGTETPVSALMLTTTDEEIIIKADKPTVDKKIDGDKDTDDSTKGLVKNNTASVGDKVPYVISSTVPSTNGYKSYKMIFTDTFSSGLTYNADSLVVTKTYVDADGQSHTDTLVKGTDYDVMQDGQEITFKFDNVKGWDGSKIEIKYTATVNDKATIGVKGNENKVDLEYSNNPTQESSSEKTPESKTRTFVTEFKLYKYDKADEKALQGVEFTLEGTKLNNVLVTDKDGKQTVVVTKENVKVTVKTDANGEVKFTGLGAGEYILTETKPLDGYNILSEPIKVVIGWTAPENDTADCTWTYSENVDTTGSIAVVKVANQGGTELPSTGGIGTTIFYVVGGFLIVAAAVLLVTRKKLALEK